MDNDRLSRARLSLEGLAIGDAFGEMCFSAPQNARRRVEEPWLPPPPWWHTDDTEMALAIVEVLRRFGQVDQDALADRFAERFVQDPERGYGKGARSILRAVLRGEDWRGASEAAFGASGSMGNGGAMRVAPLGAWFADDLDAVVAQARASAQVTHAHPEGQAGAGAVAVAAAVAYRQRAGSPEEAAGALFQEVLRRTPESETSRKLHEAAELMDASPDEAVRRLGNGFLVTAQDTVPFVIWSVARNLHSYVEAIIETASVGGDCDTNCAMVGGIVALYVGLDGLPAEWRAAREEFHLADLP